MPHSFIPPLLSADEPSAAAVEIPHGKAPFLLLCDHAGKAIPQSLGDLGLPPGEIERHIGWDIGALSVSRHLSRQLDATLIHQRYSRLVIDCNRAPGIASSIPHLSELTPIPGNIGIDAEHALAREQEGDLQVGINEPYAMTDATDYTLPVHAERRGLPYVGIEIRQDLIADERGQQAWAKRFARLLPQAWQRWQI
ncbi:N-formylglutamate amidohydrolase [Serratia nevei]|uniref:N-formylglutamate amidohydrolase n=1 Tax=Serratia nevei TaxID=2703794 RepID=UPI0018D8E18B|nr:N-formylglutamate amidohydrolase [Serratia marcescens]